jgi:hypothetical protein
MTRFDPIVASDGARTLDIALAPVLAIEGAA